MGGLFFPSQIASPSLIYIGLYVLEYEGALGLPKVITYLKIGYNY